MFPGGGHVCMPMAGMASSRSGTECKQLFFVDQGEMKIELLHHCHTHSYNETNPDMAEEKGKAARPWLSWPDLFKREPQTVKRLGKETMPSESKTVANQGISPCKF